MADFMDYFNKITGPGYFSSTPGKTVVTDLSYGRLGGTLDPSYDPSRLTGAAEGSLLYTTSSGYKDPLAGLSVEELEQFGGGAAGGVEYGGGITTDPAEQYYKSYVTEPEKEAGYKKDLEKLLDKIGKTSGELPEAPEPVKGRMPSLLDVSQSSPRYRPTQEPYTYGQFPSQLMTPEQQMQRTQGFIEDFLKATLVAAPKLTFRGLL